MSSEWISVDDKMPEQGLAVLICTNTAIITVAHRHNDNGYKTWQLYGDIENIVGIDKEKDEVLYWQNLPPLPKQIK